MTHIQNKKKMRQMFIFFTCFWHIQDTWKKLSATGTHFLLNETCDAFIIDGSQVWCGEKVFKSIKKLIEILKILFMLGHVLLDFLIKLLYLHLFETKTTFFHFKMIWLIKASCNHLLTSVRYYNNKIFPFFALLPTVSLYFPFFIATTTTNSMFSFKK